MSFCTLAGVAEAQLAENEVIGRWQKSLHFFLGLNSKGRPIRHEYPAVRAMVIVDTGVRTLTEELTNWSDDPESILRFVRRFGTFNTPKQGGEFRQSLKNWRATQTAFRQLWWHRSPSKAIPTPFFSDPEEGKEFRQRHEEWKRQPGFGGKILSLPGSGSFTALVHEGEWISSTQGQLLYVVEDLVRFLEFEFSLYPAERLRICERPGCTTPYFAAQHLRQIYCSDLCAKWGQRQWKKKWWKEHGESWRAQRRLDKSKGGKNVTRKAR